MRATRKRSHALPTHFENQNVKFFVTSRQFDLVDRFISPNYPIDRLIINLSDDANTNDFVIYIQPQLPELKDLPTYTPDLAGALGNLLVSLDKLGRHDETFSVIEKSVELWRRLAASHPTSYTPYLARALQNLEVSFDNLRRHPEALTVIERSVKLQRELVAVHPTSYTLDLAGALRNLCVSLHKSKRRPEALVVIEECQTLARAIRCPSTSRIWLECPKIFLYHLMKAGTML
ncbi:uncharacterized protein EI90DRAFT_3121949 [Cantharellus anzutake]|uniref:uncharacterized protein n=1 Tax=Cantharellus anzutake TaxID=1750568 RepID=UPI001905AFD1|nr:uncharacterized protein EI90DRAFT_3121949 [Cantharellus anzutake]KAF8333606.1 hypothetical protein EI90DRAFT_3121949 [Cantharellus anzutake]